MELQPPTMYHHLPAQAKLGWDSFGLTHTGNGLLHVSNRNKSIVFTKHDLHFVAREFVYNTEP